ncbi:MAG: FHA domain-containing protein [Deltaproteobacteria bacterium]|nr:FHA domain-containing protein [Deltaproteobacteria bacterium]
MISVFVFTGPNKDQVFEFESDAIFVGRSDENDINLIDRNVSRKHLKIIREQETYYLIDLESKNGTYIDGKQLAPNSKTIISEGTPILIGMSVLCLGKGCKEHVKAFLDMIDISESDEEILQHSVINYQQNIDLINKLSDILSTSSHLIEMLERILEIIFRIPKNITRTALIVVDPKTGDIVDSVSKLSSSSDDTSSSYNFDVVNHVIQTKKPFQFLDALDEYNDGISETLKLSKIRSALCLPLSDKSKIVGVLYIDSIEKPHSFHKEDLYLMKFLSEKIGHRLADFLS